MQAQALSGADLAELLRRGHFNDPWYGCSTSDLLAPLSAAAAASKPHVDAHSVWELVLHMTSWLREVASRLHGNAPQPPADGDWPAVPEPTPEAWAAAKIALADAVEAVAVVVAQLSADELRQPVGTTRDPALGSGVTVAQMVAGVLQHNAYHAGQIGLLAKSLTHQR